MRIIKPIEVTETRLTSSNVAEDDYPAWDASASYLVGDRRIRNHRIWEALAANAGVDPLTDAGAIWSDLGATNRWRMFDDRVSSQTTRSGGVSVTVTPRALCNALALINCSGITASVTVTDPQGGQVYQRTVELLEYGAEDWYAYFFGDYSYRSDIVIDDLPAYPIAAVAVSVASDAEAAIGGLVLGRLRALGVALYGTSVGIIDYSRKETDEFGNAKVVKRAYSKRAEFDVAIDTARVSFVQRELAEIRAQPVVWIGEGSIEATIVFGFYKDFSLPITGPSLCDGTITVEGII